MTSECAPAVVAITARPCDIPSNIDIASPSALEGRTRTSACAHNALTPASSTQSRKETLSTIPRFSASLRNSSVGPPPTSVARQHRVVVKRKVMQSLYIERLVMLPQVAIRHRGPEHLVSLGLANAHWCSPAPIGGNISNVS